MDTIVKYVTRELCIDIEVIPRGFHIISCDTNISLFSDLDKFQEGIGEKIGMCVFFMTIFSANIVNAIYHGWQLTLVMMAPMPVSTA